MWYAPRLPALLKDSDITTLGFSGWLRYPIVRAAKYALDKEEGADTSKLDAEILFLKQRIEQMSSNRDAGMPDTISETRRDGVYGGTGFGGGGGQAGWALALFNPVLFQNYITDTSLIDSVFIAQLLLTIFACAVILSNFSGFVPSNFSRIVKLPWVALKVFGDLLLPPLRNHIPVIIQRSPKK
jgi:hypothetical protein